MYESALDTNCTMFIFGNRWSIKAYRGEKVKLHMFLTSAKIIGEWLALYAR
jgi:hypothetical protein